MAETADFANPRYAGEARDVVIVPPPSSGQWFWRVAGTEGVGQARFVVDEVNPAL